MAMKYTINENVKWKAYSKGILIEPDIAINETGVDFFNQIIEGKESSEIIEFMLDKYMAEKHEIEDDFNHFVDSLCSYGVLEEKQ